MKSCAEMDERMIEVEQGTVEKYLRQGMADSKLGQTELDDISGWMDNNIGEEDNWAQNTWGAISSSATSATALRWARR